MSEQITYSEPAPALDKKSRFGAHQIALVVMWLLASVSYIVMLKANIRSTGLFRTERYILQAGYVGALLWHLIREGPSIKTLPDISPIVLKKYKFGKLLPVLVLGLILLESLNGGEGLIKLFMIFTVLLLFVLWRHEIRLREVALGLALAVIAFLGGLTFWKNGFVSKLAFFVLPAFVPLMFVAGGLLLKRTNLGASQLHTGRYKKAGASFLWGCLLFVPLGLSNAAGGSPGRGITWIDRLWMPVVSPWFSGITEEIWFRFFLISLCYFLVRPAFSKRPSLAVIFATLFSAITFGMEHGGTWLIRLLDIGLLYGLSMAVVFVRRDMEHSIGAHYMINMIPTLMVFLER